MIKRFALPLFLLLPSTLAFSQSPPEADPEAVDGLVNALEQLERAHERHLQTLTEILDKVPASARPAIERAIQRSQEGRRHARDAIQRNLERRAAGPGGAPAGKGKPGGVGGPPAGKGKPGGVGGPPAGKGKPDGAGGPPAGKGRGRGR